MTDSVPEDQATATPPTASDKQGGTKNRIKWAREHRLAFWANTASFVSAGVALAAFWLLFLTLQATRDSADAARRAAKEASEQTRIAQAALLAANRAWLDMKVEIASDLTPEVDGEHITVRATLQNVGHSPALGAFVTMEFHPNHLSEGAPGHALEQACQRRAPAALTAYTEVGRIVVPGAPLVRLRAATALSEDINAALRSINEGSKRTIATLPIMSVLVCVTYLTPEDSRPHQTAIRRDVYRRSRDSQAGNHILERGVVIPQSDLVLDDFMPGDYAD